MHLEGFADPPTTLPESVSEFGKTASEILMLGFGPPQLVMESFCFLQDDTKREEVYSAAPTGYVAAAFRCCW